MAGDGAMRGRADGGEGVGALGGRGFVENVGAKFDAEDAADGVVEAGHGDGAVVDFADEAGAEGFPILRGVEDVEAGVEGGGAVGVGAAGDLAVGVPVSHDETVEAHAAFEDVGEEKFVGVHFHPVPGIVRGHDRLRAGVDGLGVAGGVEADEVGFGGEGVALVAAVGGGTVTEKMFGGRDDVILVEEGGAGALESGDDSGSVLGDDLRILGVAFVGAAPAVVAGNGDGGGKGPVHAGGTHLSGGDFANAVEELRIVRGAEADVVREKCGAVDIVMAVDGVRGPD